MTFITDVRQAARTLFRQKQFTVVVVLTLGIALGANATVFQVVNLAMFRPLPFHEADRLFRIQATIDRPGSPTARTAISPEVFARVRDAAVFEGIVAQRVENVVLRTGTGDVERIVAIRVSSGWMSLFGLRPAIGRGFAADEEQAGAGAPAVLLSHSLWQRQFNSDPAILGRSVVIDERNLTVVGVMAPTFNYPYHAEAWLPMSVDAAATSPANLNVIARLRSTDSLDAARAQLRVLASELARQSPLANSGRSLDTVPIRQDLLENQDTLLLAVLAAVAFVLLIAGANVSSLLLTRAINRRREMAMRAALGASRGQRFRSVFAECLVLAMMAGVLGALLASWAGAVSTALLPKDFRELGEYAAVDRRLVIFMLGATTVAMAVFGVLPALRLSANPRLTQITSGQRVTGTPGDRRLLGGVVVAEIAMALLLGVGAMQMLQHIRLLEGVDVGYEIDHRLSVRVPLPDRRLPTADARVAFITRILEDLQQGPGVEDVGVTSLLPIGGGNQLAQITNDTPSSDEPPRLTVNQRIVDGHFFAAMAMPFVAGRTFDAHDSLQSDPVVIVSRALADRLWRGDDAVGKRIKRGRPGDGAPWLTVVGVVGNVREPREAGPETWYLPYTQQAAGFGGSLQPNFVIHSSTDPTALASQVRQIIHHIDQTVPVFQVATFATLQAVFYGQERLGTAVMSSFAAAGFLLVLLGVHGVTTYSLTQRLHEIGVRMAFGANVRQIIQMVLTQTSTLCLAGISIGVGGAMIVSRLFDALVPGIEAASPMVYAICAAGLAAVTILAALLPAWRATERDPLTVLRDC